MPTVLQRRPKRPAFWALPKWQPAEQQPPTPSRQPTKPAFAASRSIRRRSFSPAGSSM
eukprot:CAMPEP_0180611756 /NCGR_PEP_ID=MMETSP1037_2-20121125/30002_1 /TAXON_ID=632150 /ORGANISM="Azadinium spinosum, Strain 3D9" /LENGTH=57 /DNA_ID=CAMNT_0022631321 /DNA_START=231 /DNA_END=404 /DNA_ORIENTATION=-